MRVNYFSAILLLFGIAATLLGCAAQYDPVKFGPIVADTPAEELAFFREEFSQLYYTEKCLVAAYTIHKLHWPVGSFGITVLSEYTNDDTAMLFAWNIAGGEALERDEYDPENVFMFTVDRATRKILKAVGSKAGDAKEESDPAIDAEQAKKRARVEEYLQEQHFPELCVLVTHAQKVLGWKDGEYQIYFLHEDRGMAVFSLEHIKTQEKRLAMADDIPRTYTAYVKFGENEIFRIFTSPVFMLR